MRKIKSFSFLETRKESVYGGFRVVADYEIVTTDNEPNGREWENRYIVTAELRGLAEARPYFTIKETEIANGKDRSGDTITNEFTLDNDGIEELFEDQSA